MPLHIGREQVQVLHVDMAGMQHCLGRELADMWGMEQGRAVRPLLQLLLQYCSCSYPWCLFKTLLFNREWNSFSTCPYVLAYSEKKRKHSSKLLNEFVTLCEKEDMEGVNDVNLRETFSLKWSSGIVLVGVSVFALINLPLCVYSVFLLDKIGKMLTVSSSIN